MIMGGCCVCLVVCLLSVGITVAWQNRFLLRERICEETLSLCGDLWGAARGERRFNEWFVGMSRRRVAFLL